MQYSFVLRSIFKYSLCQYPMTDIQIPLLCFDNDGREKEVINSQICAITPLQIYSRIKFSLRSVLTLIYCRHK
jgi:hypothetical protein